MPIRRHVSLSPPTRQPYGRNFCPNPAVRNEPSPVFGHLPLPRIAAQTVFPNEPNFARNRQGMKHLPCAGRTQFAHRFRNTTTASGGSVTAMLYGRLWQTLGRLETKPPLPILEPPKSSESVFKTSS